MSGSVGERDRGAARPSGAAAWGLLAAVWAILAGAHAAAPLLGPGGAALAGSVLAVGAVVAAGRADRPARVAQIARGRLGLPRPTASASDARACVCRRAAAPVLVPVLLGSVAGWALLPVWLAATWRAGLALGLDGSALGPPLPPGAGGPVPWIAGALLAPAFEEPLYRGHLLRALRPRVGAAGALLASSALFALPHGHPWAVLGAFLGGIGLGAAAGGGRRVALSAGLHGGLNAAVIACGVPALRWAPPPGLGAAFAALALGAALLLERRFCWLARGLAVPRPALRPAGAGR